MFPLASQVKFKDALAVTFSEFVFVFVVGTASVAEILGEARSRRQRAIAGEALRECKISGFAIFGSYSQVLKVRVSSHIGGKPSRNVDQRVGCSYRIADRLLTTRKERIVGNHGDCVAIGRFCRLP